MEIIDFLNRLDVIDIQPTEYILFRFPAKDYSIETINEMFEGLSKKLPNNSIVCYPDDTSLEIIRDKKQLLEWIDYIKNEIDKLVE